MEETLFATAGSSSGGLIGSSILMHPRPELAEVKGG